MIDAVNQRIVLQLVSGQCSIFCINIYIIAIQTVGEAGAVRIAANPKIRLA